MSSIATAPLCRAEFPPSILERKTCSAADADDPVDSAPMVASKPAENRFSHPGPRKERFGSGIEPLENKPFLVLGGSLPRIPGVDFHDKVGMPSAGIVLVGRIEAAELAAILDEAPDSAIPIADFGGNRRIRRDFVGTGLDLASMAQLRAHLAPIWRRLGDLPFRGAREDRCELTLLRLAYSRGTAIEARFAPDCRELIEYPLVGSELGTRQRLEALADRELLHRRHFARTHTCNKCNSARLHTYEACPSCGGAELVDEAIVHHYRCGWQEPQSRFVKGRKLVCPKCARELRHFGVDYGKPGHITRCCLCERSSAAPPVHFACLDCGAVTPTARAFDGSLSLRSH